WCEADRRLCGWKSPNAPTGGMQKPQGCPADFPCCNLVSSLILCLHRFRQVAMLPRSLNREFAFTLNDVARMLRTYADHKASQFGITRAQWVVLVRLDRFEGLKQSELAEMLDLQPITLTRLLDRLCDSGLIERRADPNDRRAKRLYLTPQARPLLERLGDLGEELMNTALAGVDREAVERMVAQLATVKENIRHAIQNKTAGPAGEQRYG
ncbi:MAG TPA: MarR family transcriptional regulator, partial [Xanthobacteraceae bacterium]|nr:MarR family transcriptional regulator [Xanthobacteraceae bacterium]